MLKSIIGPLHKIARGVSPYVTPGRIMIMLLLAVTGALAGSLKEARGHVCPEQIAVVQDCPDIEPIIEYPVCPDTEQIVLPHPKCSLVVYCEEE